MKLSLVNRWQRASEGMKTLLTILICGIVLGVAVSFTYYVVLALGALFVLGVAILLVWIALFLAWQLMQLIWHAARSFLD